MKGLNDQDIQKLLEQGLENVQPDLDSKDRNNLNTYRLLFEALKMEPEEGPSHSFSKKLGLVLEAEYKRKNARRFYLSLVLISLVGVFVTLLMLAYIDVSYQTAFLHNLASGKWMYLFGFVLLFVVQYVDQKLLKAKFEDQHS